MIITSNTRAIDKIYRRRDRYEIPDWQRQEVWSRSKKQNLIDSILRGWKLPKFYLLKITDNPESFEVVDGQQRLSAIFEFFDDELTLSDGTAKEFGGSKYSELPDVSLDAFDDFEIEYDLIEGASDEEVKEYFQRLQDGLPLTTSERLNSVHSKLRNFAQKQSTHAFFQKVSASNKRYGHFDILAKVVAIEVDGIDVGLRHDDLRAVFVSQSSFSTNSNVAKRVRAALAYANKGFDQDDARLLRNRTIVQSVLTLCCRIVQSPKAKGQEDRVAGFCRTFLSELATQVELGQKATDFDYIDFQRTVNANVKSGPRQRQEILMRKLFATDPTAVDLFSPASISESGLIGAIATVGQEIVESVGELNELYSSKNGEDLFKATNRTTQALARLGTPLVDFDDYKRYINDLYFVFREGVGQRLDSSTVDSFNDINTLRTDLLAGWVAL